MKKSQLKVLIKKIIKEAVANEIFGFGKPKLSIDDAGPKQKWVANLLMKRGFGLEDISKLEDGALVIKLSRPYGKGRHGGPRYANVLPDGSINQEKINVDKYLNTVGESMSKPQDPRFNDGREEAPMGAVNIGEGQRPCDCGSGQESEWEYDGQGIPLVRACPKCRQKKLARYRPEILRPYTQADVDEPIEPEDDRYEETGTGAVAGYSTPYAFSKRKSGSKRALDVTTKMGYKKVKDISERVKK
jgi:hypothetical protein